MQLAIHWLKLLVEILKELLKRPYIISNCMSILGHVFGAANGLVSIEPLSWTRVSSDGSIDGVKA